MPRTYPLDGAIHHLTGEPWPPGPTPLLSSSPLRIILVPTTPSTSTTTHPFDFSTVSSVPPTTLLELRLTPSAKHLSLPIHPSTDLACFEELGLIWHCSNLYDLLLILPNLSPSQVNCIHVLKIRWSTALCILWEYEHPLHSSHVSSGALRELSGLEKVVVDCEGRESWEVEEMKKELEGCLEELRVEVEMVGGKEGAVWGGKKEWGFGGLSW